MIEKWMYFLNGLVYFITRYPFDNKATISLLDNYFRNGRDSWELFKREFRDKKLSMNDIEKQNFYNDLKTDFYPSIESYFKWYNGNDNLTKSEYFYMYKAFFEFYNDTKKEIESLNPKRAKISLNTGFQSSLPDEQIQNLFDQLKCKYIDRNTNQDNFKAIFKNEPLPAGFIPIKRVKKFTNTLLAYFVYELFYKENQTDYWHIAVSCFDKAKNLKQSLRNAYEYNPDRKPKGYKDIDTVLNNIYPPLQ
jgi:hypothetical protein